MESEYQHKVLVVDSDEQVCKDINRILHMEKIDYVVADTGESALEEIKKAKKPFSLMITDQDLDGMKGTVFLEHARELSPNSARFLMSAYPEMGTIIHAVNKGEILRYIIKPWTHDVFSKAVRCGIQFYEFFLDNEKLLELAKKQNTKLYDLNCEFMEATKSHNKTIHDLGHEVKTMEEEIKALSSLPSLPLTSTLDELEAWVKDEPGIDSEKLATLFSDTIRALFDQFNELAQRNGFEMSKIEGDRP